MQILAFINILIIFGNSALYMTGMTGITSFGSSFISLVGAVWISRHIKFKAQEEIIRILTK